MNLTMQGRSHGRMESYPFFDVPTDSSGRDGQHIRFDGMITMLSVPYRQRACSFSLTEAFLVQGDTGTGFGQQGLIRLLLLFGNAQSSWKMVAAFPSLVTPICRQRALLTVAARIALF